MKSQLILISFFTSVISGAVHSAPGSTCAAHLSDINYYFYNVQNPKVPIKVPSTNPAAIKTTHFNKSKKTIVLVHGSGGNSTGQLITSVRDAVFKAKVDINVIALDWGPIVNNCSNYTFVPLLPQCSQWVANFINTMIKSYGLKYSDLTFVGHSVAVTFLDQIGIATKGQISQMVGLDGGSGVDKSHGKFVMNIFTSSASKGNGHGHATYNPNGGPNQPGCSDWACNHWRSCTLYAESLVSNRFVSKKCDSYANYKAGKCKNNPTGIMGGVQLDSRAQGLFFLQTNDKPPYARG